jgi:hypothetical protein
MSSRSAAAGWQAPVPQLASVQANRKHHRPYVCRSYHISMSGEMAEGECREMSVGCEAAQ